jgi:cyanophycin synthetase
VLIEAAEESRHSSGATLDHQPIKSAAAMLAQPMRVLERAVYRGPHLYSAMPMIRIQLDLGALEHWPTNRLPGFADRLVALLPGLHNHGCSYKEPGGLEQRMQEGTWLGHVAEHVALELQTLAGHRATRGKTRSVKDQPGVYNVMFAYEEEDVGLLAGRYALELVQSLLPGELRGIEGLNRLAEGGDEPFEFGAALRRLKRLAGRVGLGPSTKAIVREAQRRGIPAMRLDQSSLIQLGYGAHQKRIRASVTGLTPQIATDIAGDKDLTKALLSEAALPVPRGEVVYDPEDAIRAAERLGYPVVTKPLDGNHGRGVEINLRTPEDVRWGFGRAREHGRAVIVEQHYQGNDHRILVVGGKIVAVAERVPAHVVGDSQSTIAQLVETINLDPRRGEGHEAFLTRISLDECVERFLAQTGRTLLSIPHSGEVVHLRPTANLSTGGTAIDRTDEIHPDNAAIARRAALCVGLDVGGIDFVAPDITRSVRETGGGIIEVNAAPGLRMHLQPSEGRARNVARPIIDHLFPKGQPTRVPIFAVTGTNGKSTTVRMLAHILKQAGLTVGFTTTTGIYIGDEHMAYADASGPRSARTILRDPTVEAAVLETARGGMLREGLGFDEADVGCVLNVSADHLGLRGIDTIEELAEVKSIVVEAVARQGTSVLNADDPLTAAMARRAGGRICFFSMMDDQEQPEFLRDHIARGGLAVVREPGPNGGNIVIHEDGEAMFVMPAAEIPATIEGLAEFNIANALAAIGMAFAQGQEIGPIREAMSTFAPKFEHSPGRLNIHDAHGVRVILDYAHNPEGLKALGQLVTKLRPRYRRVIGTMGMAGDRRDCDMLEMGNRAMSVFDDVIFWEDEDRRGRGPGEITGLLQRGALMSGTTRDHAQVIRDEHEAAEAALRTARPGDLVVITATHVFERWRQIQSFDPSVMPPSHGTVHHLRTG